MSRSIFRLLINLEIKKRPETLWIADNITQEFQTILAAECLKGASDWQNK